VFGFCGGLQFIGQTLGAKLDRIGRLDDGDVDPHPHYEPGWRKELGYLPVELVGDHPLLDGLDRSPVFRHAHTRHLEELPDGFVNLARTEVTEHQYIAHPTRRVAGTQFHPEYFTDEHPAGRLLIENYCAWSGIT
jgi:GMP synthase (glutamine-hydrolysing)